jgi:transposase
MDREALQALSRDELITLVVSQVEALAGQAAQVTTLAERVAVLEAKLGIPPKTPDNSSLPPSRGQKPNRAERSASKRNSRPGGGSFRALSEAPDRTVTATATACPHCDHALSPEDQPGFHAYDHVDLPPIRPSVTRVHRHRGICPCCRRGFSAPAPEGLAPGSPFGPGLAALILHLHVTQAIGFERLAKLMDEDRQAPGNAAHDTGRPQTSPRQQGLPQRPLRLHHAPRRAADQRRPEQSRSSASGLSRASAFAIGRRRDALKDGTLAHHRRDLDRRLPPRRQAGGLDRRPLEGWSSWWWRPFRPGTRTAPDP